ncbi:hypothetical protein ABPG75_004875 [Micractinium tetrahymenae]
MFGAGTISVPTGRCSCGVEFEMHPVLVNCQASSPVAASVWLEGWMARYLHVLECEGGVAAHTCGHTFSSPTVYDDLVNATCAIDALYRGSSRSKMEPAQDEGVGYRPRSGNPDPISGFNEYCWGEGQKEKWREQCGAGATAPQLTKAASVAWERLGPAARQEWRDKAAARKQLSAGSHGGGSAMPSTTADESEASSTALAAGWGCGDWGWRANCPWPSSHDRT